MKQAIRSLLNHLGLYTSSQTSDLLGYPIEDILRLSRSVEEGRELRPDLLSKSALDCFRKLTRFCVHLNDRPEAEREDSLRLIECAIDLAMPKAAHLIEGFREHPIDDFRKAFKRAVDELRKELAFQQSQSRSRIRELYLAELLGDIEEVSIPVGAVNEETGHPNAVDLLFVAAMARHRQARELFEIGTYLGRTTYHLTYASEGAVVTTVNLPPEADPEWGPYQQTYFRGRPRAEQIRQVWADSSVLDTSPYRGRMDFVFVDGDHRYEGVKADTGKAFEVLAPGGMIVWHDYAAKSPGLCRFMEEFTQQRPLFRIRKTCLLVHIDGVDPLTFQPYPMRPSRKQPWARMPSGGSGPSATPIGIPHAA
jgi:predicted O-methyltransferase YrrM